MCYLHALYFLNDEQSGTCYVDAVVFRGSAISYQAIMFQFQRNKLDQLSYIVTDFQTDSLNNNSSGAQTNYLNYRTSVVDYTTYTPSLPKFKGCTFKNLCKNSKTGFLIGQEYPV